MDKRKYASSNPSYPALPAPKNPNLPGVKLSQLGGAVGLKPIAAKSKK